jgi:hypothetical protein
MMALITMIFVLGLVGALVLHLVGKEQALGAMRVRGLESRYVAEGGGFASRAALMVLMGDNPVGTTTVDPSLTGATLANWYAAGNAGNQNAFAILDYLVLDGQQYTLNATAGTTAVTFHTNWALPQPHRKLQVPAGGPPANPLATGSYGAEVTITRRATAYASCAPSPCYVHQLNPDEYEFFYSYLITSDGASPPRARRRVTLAGDFSVRVQRQSFAQFALFTHVHLTPTNSPIWFTSRGSFDGPVHTNGQFRFAFFPKFSDTLTSVSGTAWFNNLGNPVQLAANENVVGGVRRDAPVVFDATPLNINDDNDNGPANFTRAVAAIAMPTNPHSQKGVSVGRNPSNVSPVTNLEIRQVVPELADNNNAVPGGIYVPVTDSDGNGISNAGEPLAGGIYVQGSLTSLTLALGGATNNLAVYTLVAGGQTVTVTVDRAAGTTTVSNTGWPVPQMRTFSGVPKGWQGPGNANAAIVYVEGGINSLSGTLEEKEQTTIATFGRIDITNHLQYEDPPVVTDPNDNPLNVLGLYAANNDIRITTAAPNDLILHGVLMAGSPPPADAVNSSVNVQNYNSGSPRGTVNLIGGIIEEYYGAFGTFDPATGATLTGYGRNFAYDRRMSRGFSPPYFPTTNLYQLAQGSQPLAGVRPAWREGTPP